MMANIDRDRLAIYRDVKKDGSPWQKIAELRLPADSPFKYIYSCEPIAPDTGVNGVSYFSLNATKNTGAIGVRPAASRRTAPSGCSALAKTRPTALSAAWTKARSAASNHPLRVRVLRRHGRSLHLLRTQRPRRPVAANSAAAGRESVRRETHRPHPNRNQRRNHENDHHDHQPFNAFSLASLSRRRKHIRCRRRSRRPLQANGPQRRRQTHRG